MDCASLYKEIGLQDTFENGHPLEQARGCRGDQSSFGHYEQQTGRPVRQLAIEKINKSKNPPGFDLTGYIRPGLRAAQCRKIVDDWYYYLKCMSKTKAPSV